MNKYIDNIFEEFKRATGIKNIDINSDRIINKFNNFIYERRIMGSNLLSILEDNYIYSDDISSRFLEINKGADNTLCNNNNKINVVSNMDTDIDLTVYATKLDGIDSGKVYHGSISIINDNPVIINNTDNLVKSIYQDNITTLIGHNYLHIEEYLKLLDYFKYIDVVIAVYGKLKDKDYKSKITILNKLKWLLENNVEEEYICTKKDYYAYITNKKTYRKV